MANLTLEFPVLVQYKNNEYVVKPLFVNWQSIFHERYEKALKGLITSIRKEFSQIKINKDNLDELLWFQFNPEYQFETASLEFKYGQRFFSGKISVVWFKYMKQVIVLLPAFNNYLFIVSKENAKKTDILDEAVKHIQIYGRKHKKEYDEEFVIDDRYVSTKGEFCTSVEMSVYAQTEKITLNDGGDDLFRQFFRDDVTFEGREEIAKTGHELNALYPSELNQAFYVEEKVAQLNQLIYNRENVPIVLIGPSKVGKTTVLHEAVFRYLKENPNQTFYKLDNVWHVDPSRIIAGMSIIGMWQKRFEAIIKFAIRPLSEFPRADKLYFNNIVALFRVGKSSQNNMTLSDVLKPYLMDKKLQVILEASPEEWDVACELDRGFTDLFKVIRFEEPDERKSLKIIGKLRTQAEKKQKFKISNLALLRLIELQKRFNQNGVLVGVMAESLHQLATKYADEEVNVAKIISEFNTKTHLNEKLANQDIKISKQEFYNHISERLVGQEEAVLCLTNLLHTIKAQLNNPEQPLGSFLFIGPTGVGKTQAAKILSDYLFTHEERLVRFDMNEFIDANAVNRLVGDLLNPEGQLTTKIRYNPFCVLLFDEIEKAHPDVHNLLLQVLGEGRLTDALGRTTNFCNTVIIMTSNLGAERVGKEINIQRREDLSTSTYEKAVKDFFRPEFINRIDKVVIYNKLSSSHIGLIAWLQIKALLKRHGFIRRHTILNVSQEVLESIAEKGFDPEMGGRALKRQIEKELTVLIADQLVGTLPENPVIFNLYVENQQLKPHIVSLEHIQASDETLIPDLSNIEINIDHFKTLLGQVEKIKDQITESEDYAEGIDLLEAIQENESIQSIMKIKESLLHIEDELRSIIYEYEIRKEVDLSKSSFTIKSATRKTVTGDWDKSAKLFLKGLYSQLQINEYLEEMNQAAENIVYESNSKYFQFAHDVSWIRFYYNNFVASEVDHILIKIESKVENLGGAEVKYLCGLYRYVHGFDKEFIQKGNSIYLYVKGPGVYELFKQEIGFHLFFIPHESPIPVEVQVYQLKKEEKPEDGIKRIEEEFNEIIFKSENKEKKVSYILRLYSLPNSTQSKGTVTDLRTGMINNSSMNFNDARLLFYANFPEELKLMELE